MNGICGIVIGTPLPEYPGHEESKSSLLCNVLTSYYCRLKGFSNTLLGSVEVEMKNYVKQMMRSKWNMVHRDC